MIHSWLSEPLPDEVRRAIDRLSRVPDVEHIAVMPDVHLAHDVCIGVACATSRSILPQAVGGDIGCGITSARFDIHGDRLDRERARAVLQRLNRLVPAQRHARGRPLPEGELRHPKAERIRRSHASLQLGTVGRGNHFVELQSDDQGWLWVMVHSGSRSVGPAIRDAYGAAGSLTALEARSDDGRDYLSDHDWAVEYAIANRQCMVDVVGGVLSELFGGAAIEESIVCHHNFVREEHGRWVHRKGVISARNEEIGIVAGSAGSPSYHVEGRGKSRALRSCSHGAGRRLSRTDARRRFDVKDLAEQLGNVWFDNRRARQLIEEAPLAYKDIRAVMRAQRELVRIRRTLTPLLSFKGR